MNSTLAKSKRIASNTILLFVRMFVLMIVNLYAVRLMLSGLGETDYGIFNTVAGVVTSTIFISSILAFSIQRFYSVALGENDNKKFKNIFSASINIIIISSLLLIVLLETLGLWFVSNILDIPSNRLDVTLLVFQFSIFTLLLTFFQVPFLAAIFAHEDMGVYSLVSTFEAVARLTIAWIVCNVACDGLYLYTFLLLIISLVVLAVYAFAACNKYDGCKYIKTTDKKVYSQLLSFSGWYTFGTMANMGMNQGSMILLNIYFGPLVNAAFAIALQIQNAFNSLCNSFVLPFRPAIIKAYAENNHEFVKRLFIVNNKVVYFFTLLIGLPMISEMGTILNFWLDSSDETTITFSRLIVVMVMIISLHNPISIIMHAIGKVKQYHLPVETVIIFCCPITWGLFNCGMSSTTLFYVIFLLLAVSHLLRVRCIKKYYEYFSLSEYVNKFLIPAIIVTLICIILLSVICFYISATMPRFVFTITVFPILMLCCIYKWGLDEYDRMQLRQYLQILISKCR